MAESLRSIWCAILRNFGTYHYGLCEIFQKYGVLISLAACGGDGSGGNFGNGRNNPSGGTSSGYQAGMYPALAGSNQPKDKVHYTCPPDMWYESSEGGVFPGYGLTWSLVSAKPPRQITVVDITGGHTPAARARITLGTSVLQIDGVSINATSQRDIAKLNAGLFPDANGESHTFVFQDAKGARRTITMTSATNPTRDIRFHLLVPGGTSPYCRNLAVDAEFREEMAWTGIQQNIGETPEARRRWRYDHLWGHGLLHCVAHTSDRIFHRSRLQTRPRRIHHSRIHRGTVSAEPRVISPQTTPRGFDVDLPALCM